MSPKMDAPEPLLNAVARKLGHAAGTLASITHRLTAEQNIVSHVASKPAPGNFADEQGQVAATSAKSATKSRISSSGRRGSSVKSGLGTRKSPTTSRRKTTAKSGSKRKR
jgi:hypothetical protein